MNPPARPTVHGCAFNGAVHTALQIKDCLVIVHGSQSCDYVSASGAAATARRHWRRTGQVIAPGGDPAILCSSMDEAAAVFGGEASLEAVLIEAIARQPAAIVVVTTCVAATIGDDVAGVLVRHEGRPGVPPLVFLKTDGNYTGDYLQGVRDAAMRIADALVAPDVQPEPGLVNVVGEKNLATNAEANFQRLSALLTGLGLRVGCRFIRGTTVRAIGDFRRAAVSVLAGDDPAALELMEHFRNRHGACFLAPGLPTGFAETAAWLSELAAMTGTEAAAERLIVRERLAYEAEVTALRPHLAGRSLLVVTPNRRVDWVIDTALDLGMEILKVGFLGTYSSAPAVSRHAGRVPLALEYTREDRDHDMLELAPDITLTNNPWPGQPAGRRVETMPYVPDCGFMAGLELARRWLPKPDGVAKEGWRDDLPG